MATVAVLNTVFSATYDKFTAATRGISKSLNVVKSSVMSVQGALTGLGIAAGIGEFIKAASDSERAGNKLESVLNATGHAAGFNVDQLKEYAAQLQTTTAFEDDATIASIAVLATFKNIKGQQFKDAIALAQDMSTIMGTDLTASMKTLGRALNDPEQGLSALSRVGVQFSESQKSVISKLADTGRVAEAQGKILDALREKFGGAAQADAETMAGKIAQMKNAWGDLAETIGGKLLPIVGKTAAGLQSMLVTPSMGAAPGAANFKSSSELELYNRIQGLLKQRSTMQDQVNKKAAGISSLAWNPFQAQSDIVDSLQVAAAVKSIKTVNKEIDLLSSKLRRIRSGEQALDPEVLGSGLAKAAANFRDGVIKAFDDIKDRMHDINQNVAISIDGWLGKFQVWQEKVKAAKDVIADQRSPLQVFEDRMKELKELPLTKDQRDMARMKALQELSGNLNMPDANRRAGALEFGSNAAFAAQMQGNDKTKTEKDILAEAKKQTDLQRKQLEEFQKNGGVVFAL